MPGVPPYTVVQAPLVVDGDDRASTEALFAFLDPSILAEYLVTTSWPWGGHPGEAPAGIEFLTYLQPATGSAPASAVSLRLFSRPRTGLAITVSCPSGDQLAAAVADVRSRLGGAAEVLSLGGPALAVLPAGNRASARPAHEVRRYSV